MEIIIVGLIVLAAVYYTYKHLQKEVSGKSGCDCSSCPVSKKSGCHDAENISDEDDSKE